MLRNIKGNLSVLRDFGAALMAGFYFTFRITGSVDLAIERMVIIAVLWVICALAWRALCALTELSAAHAKRKSRQVSPNSVTHSATR
ncbi:MAG: hypothetical protein ACM3S0_17125 [Acidobacteriota bacterium]